MNRGGDSSNATARTVDRKPSQPTSSCAWPSKPPSNRAVTADAVASSDTSRCPRCTRIAGVARILAVSASSSSQRLSCMKPRRRPPANPASRSTVRSSSPVRKCRIAPGPGRSAMRSTSSATPTQARARTAFGLSEMPAPTSSSRGACSCRSTSNPTRASASASVEPVRPAPITITVVNTCHTARCSPLTSLGKAPPPGVAWSCGTVVLRSNARERGCLPTVRDRRWTSSNCATSSRQCATATSASRRAPCTSPSPA